jgi:hypothetical protein
MMNRYFNTSAPNADYGNLLMIVIELLRGDIPSIIGNFRKLLITNQSAANYVGGEVLNLVFGWSPLITELSGVLRVMLTLDRMVYSETTRRKRQWDGPYRTVTTTDSRLIGNVGRGYPYYDSTRVSTGSPPPYIGDASIEYVRFQKEDYAFSSKYSSLAKPNSKNIGFAEQAEETLRRLGLVTDDPRIFWELTSWSWLVDWALTIGASITNASLYSPSKGKYNVDYAYLTTQLTERTTARATLRGSTLQRSCRVLSDGLVISNTRTRDRATPFGFGTQMASLSSSQFAILVALGLARAR